MNNEHLSLDLLVDYLHGELAPEDDALVHAHLSACAACRTERDIEASLTEALRNTAHAEEQEMPSMIKAQIWEQIRQAQPSPLARVAAWLRPAFAVPVFAALLIGGYFVSPLAHPVSGSAPTIDAMYYLQAHADQSAGTPLSEQGAQPALETSMIASTTTPQLADAETSLASSALDGSR